MLLIDFCINNAHLSLIISDEFSTLFYLLLINFLLIHEDKLTFPMLVLYGIDRYNTFIKFQYINTYLQTTP